MVAQDIVKQLTLTAGLLARFWPLLLLIGSIGYIANDLLLNAAVGVSLRHPLGGMVVLSLVVLAKLLVVVTMFSVLRPALPALAALRQESRGRGWRLTSAKPPTKCSRSPPPRYCPSSPITRRGAFSAIR
jgi:hypothetical protein